MTSDDNPENTIPGRPPMSHTADPDTSDASWHSLTRCYHRKCDRAVEITVPTGAPGGWPLLQLVRLALIVAAPGRCGGLRGRLARPDQGQGHPPGHRLPGHPARLGPWCLPVRGGTGHRVAALVPAAAHPLGDP